MKEKIKAEIRDLDDDPLGVLFIKTWRIGDVIIRWLGGTVQHRHISDKYFSLPRGVNEIDRT